MLLKRQFSIPKSEKIITIVKAFSPAEKALFFFFAIILIGSTAVMLSKINQFILVEIPLKGGALTEGVIGSPRFINPLLATTDADRDIVSLVYSGLLKATPDGILTEDVAEKYSISPDGLEYHFTIKEDVFFHDGARITADDIIFTINMAQNPTLKSPKRANWDGVFIEKINDREIKFLLKQPYAPFLENTTLGILPKHIWENIEVEQFSFSQFNIEPIGSGPYKIKKMKKDSSGIPRLYELTAFNKYALGEPNILNIKIVFYSNEEKLIDGYNDGKIDSINSISPHRIEGLNRKGVVIERSPLPRIFAVFFNQNQAPILANIEVRAALNAALDKERIVSEVLSGYGTTIDGPIPPDILTQKKSDIKSEDVEELTGKEKAKDILERNGWEFNEKKNVWEKTVKKETQELRFSLSTSNAPELKTVAEIIVDEWKSIGIQAELKIFETGDLNQNVIRPRKYDSLLFGEIIGRGLDLFAFWHSSQRNDPGLNIALYANIDADKLLEDARTNSDRETREEEYKQFEDEVINDMPAVFIYSPDFIYIVPDKIKGLKLGSVTTPGERFLNIHEWYIKTDKVWNFFAK